MKSSKRIPFHKPIKLSELAAFYKAARRAFGPQNWWPGDTPLEMMAGAVLVQNTAWTNTEKAIQNLKRNGLLDLKTLNEISEERLAPFIRASGYFNLKARRLKSLVRFIWDEYGGSLEKMFAEDGEALREKLLKVPGIGPETADSILLYAAGKPFFVIDAYTKRIFTRHRLQAGATPQKSARLLAQMNYEEWRAVFTSALPKRLPLFNDFHAQMVHLGKHFCKKSQPLCSSCPLSKKIS